MLFECTDRLIEVPLVIPVRTAAVDIVDAMVTQPAAAAASRLDPLAIVRDGITFIDVGIVAYIASDLTLTTKVTGHVLAGT